MPLVSTEQGLPLPLAQNEARLRSESNMAAVNLGCGETFDAENVDENFRVGALEQSRHKIEEITKTLNEVHFASTIKLNVGGKIYKTTLDTLRKDPDSMLCAMFSGRFELKADEDDGAYFIDRDAELFRYVSSI